jgi:hypothetical protein
MDLDIILQFNGKAVNVLRYHSTHSLILTLEGVSRQFLVHVCSSSLQRPRDIISICGWFGCGRTLYCGKHRTIACFCKESKPYPSVVEPTELRNPCF